MCQLDNEHEKHDYTAMMTMDVQKRHGKQRRRTAEEKKNIYCSGKKIKQTKRDQADVLKTTTKQQQQQQREGSTQGEKQKS